MMDSDLLFSLISVFFLVLCSAFFSGSETALTAISRARIYHLITEKNRRAALVGKVRQHKDLLIATILLGNTAVNIGASAVATAAAIHYLGNEAVLVVTLVMTMVVLLFGEVLPKTYAIQNAEKFSLAVAPIVYALIHLFSPVTRTVQWVLRHITRLFGIDLTRSHSFVSARDVVRGTIELHHREGQMVKQERDMLGSILDLSEITVGEIMVHRKNIEMIDMGQEPADIIREATSMVHSRIPLCKDAADNILGIIHVKSLIRALNESKGQLSREEIIALAIPPWFIPETTTLRDQLLAFREKRQHFALVVDEYGVLQGIVTLEDIIEEIVGEIDDEYDHRFSKIARAGDNIYLVHGTVTIRDLNRHLDWNLPDENASTIAGLVIYEARLIPPVGASYEFHGYRFTVEERRAHQITRVRVERLPSPESQETTT